MNNISYKKAIKLTLGVLDINAEDAHDFDFTQEEELLHISFYTDYQWYECYLDLESGELSGINCEPSTNMSYGDCLSEASSAHELIKLSA